MARVIRGHARVVPTELVDASARADAIVEAARAEAVRTQDAVREEARAAAKEEAKAELAAAMVGIEIARTEAVDEVHRDVATFAIAVARGILGEAFEADPGRVRALVDDALARVARRRRARVRVHPDDVEHLEGVVAEVVGDASLSPGDCVVESDLGDVDGRIETRLAQLRHALERGLERKR